MKSWIGFGFSRLVTNYMYSIQSKVLNICTALDMCKCVYAVLRLLEYCRHNGAYTGCEFSGTDGDEELLTRLSDLKLDGKAKFLFFYPIYWYDTVLHLSVCL